MDPTAARPAPRWLLPLLIAALTFAAFIPSLHGEFLNWDDDANFTHNLRYRGLGPDQLRWMFSDHYGHYMPVTWLTLGLDYDLWGMNPAGYHATSMILHSFNAVLLFLLLRILILRSRGDLPSRILEGSAAAGALFFSLHPLRAESVAWITERRDVTAGAFFLFTLLAYVRMTAETAGSPARRKWLWLSVAAFAGMILSKAMGMTLPLVLLVIDAVPLRRFSTERPAALLKEKLPFFVLMVAGLAATSYSQNHAQAIYTRDAYPLLQSAAQPGFRISFYALKTLWPLGLSPLYWYRPALGLPQVLGWLAVLGVSVTLFLRRRSLPAPFAAWLSYLLLIAPVAGIFQAGPHFAADRYTYFACLPFAALFAAALASLPRPGLLAVAAAAILVGLAILTSRQCVIWKDSVALWTRAIDLDSDVYFTWNRRGEAYAARGDWDRALGDYDRSIELNGGWPDSLASRARARVTRGNPAGAIEDASRALQLDPKSGDAFHTRGLALARLGKPREAIADYSKALELRPQFVEARLNRAAEQVKIGQVDGALADLDEAIHFDPQPQIYNRRAMVRGMKGDLEGAIADCTEALRLNPGFVDAYANRGFARVERGDRSGAAQDLARALELAPPDWPQRRQVEGLLRQARGLK
jgi:tetratricopeptide (TPR) repeat protein